MQIIWVSGSTTQIKRINITRKTLVKVISISCLSLLLLGAGIHFLGFRVAVQFKPELAREMGGVITLHEKDEIESAYRTRLEMLQTRLSQAADQIQKIQTLKDRFTDLAVPAQVKQKLNDDGGKGGPYIPINFKHQSKNGLINDFDTTLDGSQSLISALEKLEKKWEHQYQWLNQLPTSLPIDVHISRPSSQFGVRVDPITRQISQHLGVDFSAPIGTPILATGNGTVLRVETDQGYGKFVEIKHSDGFVTKYAHTSKIYVREGQNVSRKQAIGEVGNSGRSTGSHLHYEISVNGSPINPMQILAIQHP